MWRDLWARKGALLALLAIVTVGVGCYVGMAAVFRDMDSARERYYRAYRMADFWVDLKRAPSWSVEAVAALPNVASAHGRVSFPVRIDLPHVPEPISGTAISLPARRRPVPNDVLLRSGAWFSSHDAAEVILNEAFARANGLEPGHRVRVLLLDKQHDLLVVGTAMSPEFVYLIAPGAGLAPDPARFGVLYLPERFLRRSCDMEGAYNQLIGSVHDRSRTTLDHTLALIGGALDPYGVTNSTPIQEHPSARFLEDELKGLRVTSTVIPVVFLAVAALVLNVLMGRLITQQRTVVGTLKALGYGSGAVTRHYLAYGLAIGALGGLCGMGVGWFMQGGMLGIYRQFFALPRIEQHFRPDIFLGGLGISILFALLGTLQGLRVAARLQPAEAMRPPPPERGGKVLLEYIPALWRPLPFTWKMMLRAVFRNPFRSAVTAAASVIATAIIVMTLCQVDALDYLMAFEFTRVSHQDVTVALRDPTGRGALSELRALPGVSEAEPQLGITCDLSKGPRRKRIGVSGLPRGNRLYTPLDAAGRAIVPPEEGLVLSRKLAQLLDVKPGDKVRLRPLVGQRREVEALVVGTVEGFLGLSAYADIHYLSRLIGEAWAANVLLSTVHRGSDSRPFLSKLKDRPEVVGLGERRRALDQIQETFGKTMGTMIGFTVFFAGLVAFGSVLNAALVSLNERQREVGTLRVLGYTPRQIAGIFAGESLLLNIAGIVLGVFAGIGFTHLIAMAYDTELYRFPVIVRPSRLVASAALMTAFVGVAQLIVYHLIRKLPWLDVLKIKE